MTLRIGRRGRPFLLVGKREDREKLHIIPLRDERDARRWLKASLLENAELDAIRVWWAGQGGLARRDSAQLLTDVAHAAVEGRIAYAEVDPKPEEEEGDAKEAEAAQAAGQQAGRGQRRRARANQR